MQVDEVARPHGQHLWMVDVVGREDYPILEAEPQLEVAGGRDFDSLDDPDSLNWRYLVYHRIRLPCEEGPAEFGQLAVLVGVEQVDEEAG